MTTNEAGEALGLSPHTVLVQIKNGKLTAEKIGRDWHVSPAEVERYRRVSLGKRAGTRASAPISAPISAAPRFCPAPKPSARKRAKVSAE